ncbi:MAG: hypothetical protein ABIS50_05450 [Luteolibacter sp.]|uniref:hypothetical protein n=1 Tax=Luteolibacter sp. TaxID=1962973 RepID=UPI003265F663
MEAPSPRYILTRATFIIVALVVGLYGMRFVKKIQRQSAIISDLRSISSDSSFFHQFYAEDAQKSMIRAIGLIAEANELGTPPEIAIKKSQGIDTKLFASDDDRNEPPLKIQIVMASLRANYENFHKLGYKADFQTLEDMKSGKLPPIPSGPESGKKPVVETLIPMSASPGIEKVMANLEIRPPQPDGGHVPTDIEIAAAKRLANDLCDAKIIEEPVRDKILKALTKP